MEIVGFYCANEGYADKEVSATTAKIASRIDENIGGGALLLMVWVRLAAAADVTHPLHCPCGSWMHRS